MVKAWTKWVRISLLTMTISLLSSSLLAYPLHRRLFRSVYKKSVNCTLCHADASGSQRTPYALDWSKRDQALGGQTQIQAFRQIESLDSDGDGVTNRREIDGGSNPGDAKSTPASPGRPWQRTQAIPIPVEQLKLVLGAVDGIEASEPMLDAAQRSAVEAGAGLKLNGYDLLPTLYFGVVGATRRRVAAFAKFPLKRRGEHFSMLASFDEQARLYKVALFSTGAESGSSYMRFLRCLEGKSLKDMRWSQARGCPGSSGGQAVKRQLVGALRKLGWTIQVLASASAAPVQDPGNGSNAIAKPKPSPSSNHSSRAPPARLNLGGLPAASRYAPMGTGLALVLLLAAVVLWVVLVVVTVRWALATGAGGASYTLSALSPSLRLLALLTLVGLLLAQLFGAMDVYAQTRAAHASSLEYFQYLSWPRLLGISHSHFFGFTVMYGLLGLMLAGTRASEAFKCALLSLLLWSGIFDVFSWWGVKALSSRFEWLSLLTGSLAGLGALAVLSFVVRDLVTSSADVETIQTDTLDSE
jgi:hypothetical protein